ncbi:hypothetical protein [Streptomyces longwoodensis]|uniref:hypothetical protein n=1 Tax=Streptomyces longwoodensis TaxID=68231 RepID=UPI0033E680FC
MSAIRGGRHIALSRVDEAYRKLTRHCTSCRDCLADRQESCPDARVLLTAWSSARKAARP